MNLNANARLSPSVIYQCDTYGQNLKDGLFPFFVSVGLMTNGSNDSNDDSGSIDDDGTVSYGLCLAENKVQKNEIEFRVLICIHLGDRCILPF